MDYRQSPETETRLILSVLMAYLTRPAVPWGITMAGWRYYVRHYSAAVRAAVATHPFKFKIILKKNDPSFTVPVASSREASA